MHDALRRNCLLLAAGAVILASAVEKTYCQSTLPAKTGAPIATLTPYTATDQSASAGVPAGWQVTQGEQTVIQMSGPQGVALSLGRTVIARNGAFQAGQKPANGIDLAMPYTATLAQKLTMILQQASASSGQAVPQVKIDSSTPLQLPAAVGQCARFLADTTGKAGAVKLLTVFCSLPVDSAGIYKNIMLLAEAPTAVAAQAAPTAQAVFQSYRIPAAWLQRKLAPVTAPAASAANAQVTAAETAMINRATMQGAAAVDNSANCFDLSVLRQTPTYQLPRSCGGTMPN